MAMDRGMEAEAERIYGQYHTLLSAVVRGILGDGAEERRLFTLRFLYEWPPAEIGRSLHLSRAAVDKRVSRLRGKLKKLLALQGITVDGKE